jgi:hypothetical protein
MNLSIPRLVLLPVLLVVSLSACVSAKQWTSTGGNKDSGLVRISYQYAEFHQPDLSEAQAMELAANRCEAWGYKRAEPVAGLVRECSSMDGGNCELWTVTREFQCASGDSSYSARLSK